MHIYITYDDRGRVHAIELMHLIDGKWRKIKQENIQAFKAYTKYYTDDKEEKE